MEFAFNMKVFLLLVLSSLVLGTTLPNGLTARNSANLPVGKMTFKGTVGGYYVEHSGSAEEIVAHAQSLYPEMSLNLTDPSNIENFKLGSRDALYKNGDDCCPIPGQNWDPAPVRRINEGIQYLYHLQGQCGFPRKFCSRVSCSWDSAIIFCNDNEYEIHPTCSYIGTYAYDLMAKCQFQGGSKDWFVCGQAWDTDNYNVIVRFDGSNGCD